MKINHLFLLLPLLSGLGCTSLSTLQDARTTPAGTINQTVAAGTIGANITIDGSAGINGDIGKTITVPLIEWMGRYGFSESWDIGIRTSLWAHGIDTKIKFIDGSFFKMSSGLGINYLTFETTNGFSTTKFTSIDYFIPLYMNFHFTESALAYLVPKYLHRATSSSSTATPSSSIDYFGGSLGFKYGRFFVEGTMLTGENESNETITITQSAAGFTW